MSSLERLKNEKEKLDSQIQNGQIEIANLKKVIKDKDVHQKNIRTEYQKEIVELRKVIDKHGEGKFNPNDYKIKLLNIQLRH